VAALLRRRRGLDCDAEQVLITRGAQQAFTLIARALLWPGAVVAVEDPGYRGFGLAARAAGVRVLPVAVDDHGLDVQALRRLKPVCAAYVTPAHQFPRGAILPAARRQGLL
jgi:GntR family transcriptional regulator/MocR family aminotransferase